MTHPHVFSFSIFYSFPFPPNACPSTAGRAGPASFAALPSTSARAGVGCAVFSLFRSKVGCPPDATIGSRWTRLPSSYDGPVGSAWYFVSSSWNPPQGGGMHTKDALYAYSVLYTSTTCSSGPLASFVDVKNAPLTRRRVCGCQGMEKGGPLESTGRSGFRACGRVGKGDAGSRVAKHFWHFWLLTKTKNQEACESIDPAGRDTIDQCNQWLWSMSMVNGEETHG